MTTPDAVEMRQHAVDDDRIVALVRRAIEAGVSVRLPIDAVAVRLQTLLDESRVVAIVFDDENLHGPSIRAGAAAPLAYGFSRIA